VLSGPPCKAGHEKYNTAAVIDSGRDRNLMNMLAGRSWIAK